MLPISFTSKIVVTNDFGKFLNCMLSDKTECCEMEDLKKGDNIYTLGAATCSAGGATNQEDCYMFHYCQPENHQINEVSDKFKKMKNKKVNAFITGGFANSALSEKYFEKFMDKFKKLKITPSILWGQKKSSTSVHYSTKTDTWTVYNDEEQIHSLKDLKNAYKIVKIADGDELWIEDKRVK